ncbi:hypothetical protein L3X38_036180 [Prunus dulcis]|uniref:Uncharacterized protein n=1 Tax=Prunus dulcis TaxID=3755 RepID=A0AAD4V186_PRUDU|nr:hypothetical protein L3X38_036180 [Prunus dulcis]
MKALIRVCLAPSALAKRSILTLKPSNEAFCPLKNLSYGGWNPPKNSSKFLGSKLPIFGLNFGSIFWLIRLESRLDMGMYGKRRKRRRVCKLWHSIWWPDEGEMVV